jgi:hypothetical protein
LLGLLVDPTAGCSSKFGSASIPISSDGGSSLSDARSPPIQLSIVRDANNFAVAYVYFEFRAG